MQLDPKRLLEMQQEAAYNTLDGAGFEVMQASLSGDGNRIKKAREAWDAAQAAYEAACQALKDYKDQSPP